MRHRQSRGVFHGSARADIKSDRDRYVHVISNATAAGRFRTEAVIGAKNRRGLGLELGWGWCWGSAVLGAGLGFWWGGVERVER